LLAKVVATRWFDNKDLAVALGVTVPIVDLYLAGELPMSPDRQLRLAAFVIRKVPPLSRMGLRLRGQASAAMMYESGQNHTHTTAPVPPFK
jgi:hypothetical protein